MNVEFAVVFLKPTKENIQTAVASGIIAITQNALVVEMMQMRKRAFRLIKGGDTMDFVDEIYITAQERYNVKLSKYKAEDIDDELSDVLYEEALREAIAANYINNGRTTRC